MIKPCCDHFLIRKRKGNGMPTTPRDPSRPSARSRARKTANRQHRHDTLTIRIQGEHPQYIVHTDLSEGELYAIGYVTVQWAHLEHALLLATVKLAAARKRDPPSDTFSLSFERRLRALHE